MLQHQRNKGFTLIEMVIAIAIFAIIAVAGYSSLSNFNHSSKQIEKTIDSLQDLQTFLTFVDRDFSQVFNQEIYFEKNELKIQSIQDNQIIDISYNFKEDEIIRSEDETDLSILTNISKLKVRLLDDNNKWQTKWQKNNKNYIKVIEFKFNSDFGEIIKLVLIDE